MFTDPEKRLEYSKFVHDHVYGATQTEKKEDSGGTSKWTSSCIKQLITERLSKEEEFNNPTCRKKKLWEGISKNLEEKTGSYFDAYSCDIKYRNLLSTYRNNKKRLLQCGEGCINWEYFHQFDEVLGYKTFSALSESALGDSLILNTSSKRPASQPASPAGSNSGEDVQYVTTENKKTKICFSDYFALKLGRDMELRKEQLDLRKKELALKEKIWKEKKALKEKEIKAITQLAKAMSEKNGE